MSQSVIIIGAGAAGLALACSLEPLGLSVTIIEKNTRSSLASPTHDGREIAITHGSKTILHNINVWERIPKNSLGIVKAANVINGNSPYTLHFHNHNSENNSLGTMVSLHLIRKALFEETSSRPRIRILDSSEVTHIHTSSQKASLRLANNKELHADLIIAADSKFSPSRKMMGIGVTSLDFGKTIILTHVQHEKSHHNTAYECFFYHRTLALLPLVGNTSSLVMTVPHHHAPSLLSQDNQSLALSIQEQFSSRFGHMTLSSERFSYPISASFAHTFINTRFALIGDAAHSMHPVTAHGLNLSLKAQHTLAQQINLALRRGLPIHNPTHLSQFNSIHRRTSLPLYHATNTIAQLYTRETTPHKFIRQSLLHLGNAFLPAKRAIVRSLTGTPPL